MPPGEMKMFMAFTIQQYNNIFMFPDTEGTLQFERDSTYNLLISRYRWLKTLQVSTYTHQIGQPYRIKVINISAVLIYEAHLVHSASLTFYYYLYYFLSLARFLHFITLLLFTYLSLIFFLAHFFCSSPDIYYDKRLINSQLLFLPLPNGAERLCSL